jgi:hypothetical protein
MEQGARRRAVRRCQRQQLVLRPDRPRTRYQRHAPQAEDYYVANKLMKGYIGTANIDTNSRLCMSSAVAGQVRAFGVFATRIERGRSRIPAAGRIVASNERFRSASVLLLPDRTRDCARGNPRHTRVEPARPHPGPPPATGGGDQNSAAASVPSRGRRGRVRVGAHARPRRAPDASK